MHRVHTWVPYAGAPMPLGITPQRAARFQGLHDLFPAARVISIVERGPGDRVACRPWEVMYIMAGQGPYGRPAQVRVGTAICHEGRPKVYRAAELGF